MTTISSIDKKIVDLARGFQLDTAFEAMIDRAVEGLRALQRKTAARRRAGTRDPEAVLAAIDAETKDENGICWDAFFKEFPRDQFTAQIRALSSVVQTHVACDSEEQCADVDNWKDQVDGCTVTYMVNNDTEVVVRLASRCCRIVSAAVTVCGALHLVPMHDKWRLWEHPIPAPATVIDRNACRSIFLRHRHKNDAKDDDGDMEQETRFFVSLATFLILDVQLFVNGEKGRVNDGGMWEFDERYDGGEWYDGGGVWGSEYTIDNARRPIAELRAALQRSTGDEEEEEEEEERATKKARSH